eukprot:359500-Chlamydomonas_euryale.AAC.2
MRTAVAQWAVRAVAYFVCSGGLGWKSEPIPPWASALCPYGCIHERADTHAKERRPGGHRQALRPPKTSGSWRCRKDALATGPAIPRVANAQG